MDSALDSLDVCLLELVHAHPRVGVLELSRLAGVARATVSARLARMESAGVLTGYGPDLDLEKAGYPVQAFATLEIAQGRLGEVAELLTAVPGVVEAYATTGSGDVVCRLAAESNQSLQDILLDLHSSDVVRRTVSVMVLSVLVAPRTLQLLTQPPRPQQRGATGARSRGARATTPPKASGTDAPAKPAP